MEGGFQGLCKGVKGEGSNQVFLVCTVCMSKLRLFACSKYRYLNTLVICSANLL